MESYSGSHGVVLVVAQLALFANCSVSAQGCLLAARGEPPFRDYDDTARLPSGTQAIIITYKFTCCGKITTWQTYVTPGGSFHQGAYDITFQVWRPSPTLQGNGYYSLVGENKFTRISLGAGGLVNETPEPSNILSVQPGDVVGYYTFSRDPQDVSGNGIQLDTEEIHDRVWYHTSSKSEPLIIVGKSNCSFPVGIGSGRCLSTFVTAAPVLSVTVVSFVCLPTPKISPSSSSSLPPSNTTNSATPVNSVTPANFGTTISPTTNAATPVNTTSEGYAAMSTAVIASVAVGGSALLLILLSMLVIAVIVTKVHHKRRRTLVETSTRVIDSRVSVLSMNMQGNEAYTSTSPTDECYTNIINMESNLAYQHANTLSMKMWGNGAYTATSHTTDECCASTIDMPDRIYETIDTECEDPKNYEYIDHPSGTPLPFPSLFSEKNRIA